MTEPSWCCGKFIALEKTVKCTRCTKNFHRCCVIVSPGNNIAKCFCNRCYYTRIPTVRIVRLWCRSNDLQISKCSSSIPALTNRDQTRPKDIITLKLLSKESTSTETSSSNNHPTENTNNDTESTRNDDLVNDISPTTNNVINIINNQVVEVANNAGRDMENAITEINKQKVLGNQDTSKRVTNNEISQWSLHRAHRDHRMSEEEEMIEEPIELVNNTQAKKGTKRKQQTTKVCKAISTKDLCQMLISHNNLNDFINTQKQNFKNRCCKCVNCIAIYCKCRIITLLKEHEDKFHPEQPCRLSCINNNNFEIVKVDLTDEETCDSHDAEDGTERSENELLAIIRQNLIRDSDFSTQNLSKLKNLTQNIISRINQASSSGGAISSCPISEPAISDSNDSSVVPIKNKKDQKGSKSITKNSNQGTLNLQPGTPGTAGIHGTLLEAPVFHPTDDEFRDPVAYFEKIMPVAAKHGLCKVIPPPGFKPTCNTQDSIQCKVVKQYLARGLSRWGPFTRELSAIRAQAALQNENLAKPASLEGIEVDLVKMFHAVQRKGGVTALNKEKWREISRELNFRGTSNREEKLDLIYKKWLVPYDSLTERGRQEHLNNMEVLWRKRDIKMLKRAMNPLHRQKRLLAESDAPSDEKSDDSSNQTLKEVEDCVVRSCDMTLSKFSRIARNASKIYFPDVTIAEEVELSHWKIVELRNKHVCVLSASVDTGSEDHGFTTPHYEERGIDQWNLNNVIQNNGNVLRHLGPVTGLTVPTLHFGMVYSTKCWHRDPHGLPWMEYLYEGAQKIWYAIPDEENCRFRKAVENLSLSSCQNKSIWLPPNTTMIPPKLLLEHGVSLSKVVQNPRDIIIVLPKSYSCSISTGYTVSESVYFATYSWVNSIQQVFQELRDNCEPTMFSLEHLLFSLAGDPSASPAVLQMVNAKLVAIISDEMDNRTEAQRRGLVPRVRERQSGHGLRKVLADEECVVCRTTLYVSRVKGVFHLSTAVCIKHAIRIIDDPKISKRELQKYEFELFFSDEELRDIMDLAKERLSNDDPTSD